MIQLTVIQFFGCLLAFFFVGIMIGATVGMIRAYNQYCDIIEALRHKLMGGDNEV
jgi:hypothetical protein